MSEAASEPMDMKSTSKVNLADPNGTMLEIDCKRLKRYLRQNLDGQLEHSVDGVEWTQVPPDDVKVVNQ